MEKQNQSHGLKDEVISEIVRVSENDHNIFHCCFDDCCGSEIDEVEAKGEENDFFLSAEKTTERVDWYQSLSDG